jgi:predicted DNA-binding transcriptional regulator YafY
MNVIIKHVDLMNRIDQLIRLKATGRPLELAAKMGISKTKLYRIINIMRELNAPLEYDSEQHSYIYVKAVGFKFGFFTEEINTRKNHSSVE